MGVIGDVLIVGGLLATIAGASSIQGRTERDIVHARAAGRSNAAVLRSGRIASALRKVSHATSRALAAKIRSQSGQRLGADATAVLTAINEVRAQFGRPPARATTIGHSLVRAAASAGRDPVLLPLSGAIPEEFGIWGMTRGSGVTIASSLRRVVNAWVFSDGWRGSATTNLACSAPNAPGCNRHREAVLSSAPMPGAHLYVDIAVLPSLISGETTVEIAAQLIWVAP